MKRPFLLFAVLLAAALTGGAGETIRLYVGSRAYDVSVAPVDEESKSAESSMLYRRDAIDGPWTPVGECKKENRPGGDVRFTRTVETDRDGAHHYTSRPIVGGKVENPPKPEDPDQAVVVVDTIPPTVEILEPPEGFAARPGQRLTVAWIVSDEHLGERPAALSYTTDGGKSWSVVQGDLPAEGDAVWTVPPGTAGPVAIRLAALDRAGNMGRAIRTFELESVPPPEPADETARRTEEPTPAPEAGKPADAGEGRFGDSNRSWLYYLMAVNLMRQNKPADALQYYWLSVKEDPDFINAWADIALAYIDLGAYRTAREITERTRDRAPERIDLAHLLGETYHAEGMDLLGRARNAEERTRAQSLIDEAVGWYGRALDMAADEWRLAEQAASFYRLGEICYYVNMDKDGARAYWTKILSLHSPTPNYDLILWSSSKDKARERKRHERYTYQRVSLEAWQNWARGYIRQMDERERAGIVDLMPAQRISVPVQSLSYAGNAINPGLEDGRSLFSLPGYLGSPGDVGLCEGVAGPPECGGAPFSVSPRSQPSSVAEGYSFYAPKDRPAGAPPRPAPRRRGRSAFSGGPDPVVAAPADPYDFPRRGRARAPWNDARPYGDQPLRGW